MHASSLLSPLPSPLSSPLVDRLFNVVSAFDKLYDGLAYKVGACTAGAWATACSWRAMVSALADTGGSYSGWARWAEGLPLKSRSSPSPLPLWLVACRAG